MEPVEVEQPKFRKSLLGYQAEEVERHIEQLMAEISALKRKRHKLELENEELRGLLGQHRDREKTLKDTMMTAQRVSEELRTNAQKEANLIIARAELSAEKIIDESGRRHAKLLADISEVGRRRMQMVMELKGVLHTHLQMLEMEDDGRVELEHAAKQ